MRYSMAARIEDESLNVAQAVVHRLFDWLPRVEQYTGLGTPTKVRVLCRTLLSAAEKARERPSPAQRGFRSYLCLPADNEQVEISVGGRQVLAVSDRAGYVDMEIDLLEPLAPGWHSVKFTAVRSGATAHAPAFIVDPETTTGVVSDIDDTAMVTVVPRLAVAAWNTFIERGTDRQPVVGMPDLLNAVVERYPGAPVVYLSNGAWNTARSLRRFLRRFHFPAGPLLLTDFGPTSTGLFRSGKAHKRAQLAWLMERFPQVAWILIGDDGQSDPLIYSEVARQNPGRVAAIGIRTLHLVTRLLWLPGTDPASRGSSHPADVPFAEAPTGLGILEQFRELGILDK